jgi:hypothetical protein
MLTDVLYALSKHHLVKYLTATKANKAVYKVSTCTMRQRPTISHDSSISGIWRFWRGETSFLRKS